MNISHIVNKLARIFGVVFIPKWLYRWYWLSVCERCRHFNFIGACAHKVIFKNGKFRYQHAYFEDCKTNKERAKEIYKK